MRPEHDAAQAVQAAGSHADGAEPPVGVERAPGVEPAYSEAG
jgi:hypothetical protein